MRYIFLLALLFCCLTSLNCTTSKNISDSEKIIDKKIVIKETKDVVFEINAEHTSPVDLLNGKILYFRLYKDGFVEFDDYPTESTNGKQIILEKEKTLKQYRISESNLIELKNLLSDSDYQSLKNKYEKIVSSCDSIPLVEIKDKKKTIKIIWCDNLTIPHNSPEFPKVLTKLFQEIHKIKSDALGKPAASL